MTDLKHGGLVILDYGSQYTQLIARRVREQGVYAAIVPYEADEATAREHAPRGVILSGGPSSVYEPGAPGLPAWVLAGGLPVLGICYGMQLLTHALGGTVAPAGEREYGPADIRLDGGDPLWAGLDALQPVWMSHGDRITAPPPGFVPLARSTNSPYAAIRHAERPLYGVQFHPEVTHTPAGADILRNFALGVCGCEPRWQPGAFVEETVQAIRAQVGGGRVVLGLSGGVDSAVVAYLCARAFGPSNVYAFRMPYKISSQESLDHAQLCIDDLGINASTIEITDMVDGYLGQLDGPIDGTRLGNVCARSRMIVLFDQSARLSALPIGTGNKSERLLGYYTWHADDSPPINPLGDLLKTQVWQLARELGVPKVIVNKPATADLVKGQTDEGDFGVTYALADRILHHLVLGYPPSKLVEYGFDEDAVRRVVKRLNSTHWKRRMPTVAMMSTSAIGEYYLRPVDY
jgi:NAD+ synthase